MGELMTRQLQTRWKESSVYQIYPASFLDTKGSGEGDLRGIISRVDYLNTLGVDIVWLSPIFESPQVDMGYDISDYKTIDPRFGHISDVDELRDELHKRGMKLLLDLVVNHTSDQHEWFKESRKSRDNPYRDWYIWRPPVYDAQGNRQAPNNWGSHFSESAWEYNEETDEYYLHLFCKEQPDLNWENPAVRKAVHDIIRFWLDRGIDGFRMDVINFISKHPSLPDSDRSVLPGAEYYACGPRLHEYLRDIGDILREYDAFSVGEMPCVDDQWELIKAVGADRGELNMIFHFELMDMENGPGGTFSPGKWTLPKMKSIVNKWQRFMYDNDGWNALYLENHDQPRAVSRFMFDDKKRRAASAKLLAAFLIFQAGTPFMYQGQEIGMTNVPKDWPIEEYKDVQLVNHWNLHKDTADEKTKQIYLSEYQKKSRDNARTPMQWDDSFQAGFTSSAEPWLRVNDNYKDVNVTRQVGDEDSVFGTYRRLLRLRKEYRHILVYGDFEMVDEANDKVFAYKRTAENGDAALVVCNFSEQGVNWKVEGKIPKQVLFSPLGRTMDDLVVDGQMRLGVAEVAAFLYR